jgi:hypothetical protein
MRTICSIPAKFERHQVLTYQKRAPTASRRLLHRAVIAVRFARRGDHWPPAISTRIERGFGATNRRFFGQTL